MYKIFGPNYQVVVHAKMIVVIIMIFVKCREIPPSEIPGGIIFRSEKVERCSPLQGFGRDLHSDQTHLR